MRHVQDDSGSFVYEITDLVFQTWMQSNDQINSTEVEIKGLKSFLKFSFLPSYNIVLLHCSKHWIQFVLNC